MATVILSTIGQAYFGPIGGFVGSLAGSAIDRQLFDPNAGRRVEGYIVQSSAYGLPIPLAFGEVRLAGNVIWSDGLIETQGGGGGKGGAPASDGPRFISSFAVALSQRPILRVGRIWADGKLIREADGDLAVGGELRVYLGDEDQGVDPVMEAALGVGEVPAYRGLAYAVFENLELGEFGNRVPNLTLEVIADDGAVAIQTVIEDLAVLGDFGAVDAQGLSGTLTGYVADGGSSHRRVLDDLGMVHEIVALERGEMLIFKAPPQRAVLIDDADLGASSSSLDAPRLSSSRVQDWELPREVLIQYLDPERDYQPNVQRARRVKARRGTSFYQQAGFAISADEAKATAERMLNRIWTARRASALALPLRHAGLEVGDFIMVSHDGAHHPFLIDELGFEGLVWRLSGAHFAPENSVANVLADGGSSIAQTTASQGVTHFQLLDLPLLPGESVDQPRYHWAASGENAAWRSAALFESLDGEASFTRRSALSRPARSGVLESPVSAASPALWDEVNRPVIRLYDPDASLESMDNTALFNGANAAYLGGEIIQYRQAVLLPDGRYELRGLLRARLGSDAYLNNHEIGEDFVALNGPGLENIETNLGHVGQTRHYRAVGTLELVEAAVSQSFLFQARGLRPLSPVHVKAKRRANDDLSFCWVRRSRMGAEWIDGADAPLAEAEERYELEIFNGSILVRSVALTAPDYLYLAADQMDDFGVLPLQFDVRVYQISALVGRGDPAVQTFTV